MLCNGAPSVVVRDPSHKLVRAGKTRPSSPGARTDGGETRRYGVIAEAAMEACREGPGGARAVKARRDWDECSNAELGPSHLTNPVKQAMMGHITMDPHPRQPAAPIRPVNTFDPRVVEAFLRMKGLSLVSFPGFFSDLSPVRAA